MTRGEFRSPEIFDQPRQFPAPSCIRHLGEQPFSQKPRFRGNAAAKEQFPIGLLLGILGLQARGAQQGMDKDQAQAGRGTELR